MATPDAPYASRVRLSVILDIFSKYTYLMAREIAALEEGRVPDGPSEEELAPDGKTALCPKTDNGKHMMPAELGACVLCGWSPTP